MKKIIALALALVMALSMASVAFAAFTPYHTVDGTDGGTFDIFPGETIGYEEFSSYDFADYKVSKVDFTTGALQGASLIDEVKLVNKQFLYVTVKESYAMMEETDKFVDGVIELTKKADKSKIEIAVKLNVNNDYDSIDGVRKATDAGIESLVDQKNFVNYVETAGYVKLALDASSELVGTVKVAEGDKVYLNSDVNLKTADIDSYEALEAVLGEDYEGIVEMVTFETKAAEDVAWTYKAWQEDPHFFYAWDGEKLTQIEAKYDDDEDVDAYVFTADAAGTILVVDTEIVLAEEETKNPDTGANDVVGVAAALAVVSLVAAGAVSLKK